FYGDFDSGGNVSQGAFCQSINHFCWHQTTNASDPYGPGNGRITAGSTVMAAGQWYHVAVVRDDVAKTVTMYVNGAVDGTATYTGSVVGLQSDKYLGVGSPLFFGSATHGQLDEVTLYNRALTANEIAWIYTGDGSGKRTSNRGNAISVTGAS